MDNFTLLDIDDELMKMLETFRIQHGLRTINEAIEIAFVNGMILNGYKVTEDDFVEANTIN